MNTDHHTDTPRLWFYMDVLFTEQEAVQSACRRFGPGGPYALVVLLCEAYKRFFLRDEPGVIDMRYTDLAYKAGLEDGDEAREILSHYEQAGILQPIGCVFDDPFEECVTFRLRFLKWGQWTPRSLTDPTHSDRQAAYIAKKAAAKQSGNATLKSDSTVTLDVDVDVDTSSKGNPPVREEVLRLSTLLADLIRKRDPKARVTPAAKAWTDPVRLLLDKDDRSEADIEHVIRWSQDSDFWKSNILSPQKLRLKFDMLVAKAGKPKGNADDFFKRNGM